MSQQDKPREQIDIKYWFIQKPVKHNVPLQNNGAVFQTFMPTISEQGCEWVRVYDADYVDSLLRLNDTILEQVQRANKALNEIMVPKSEVRELVKDVSWCLKQDWSYDNCGPYNKEEKMWVYQKLETALTRFTEKWGEL